MPSESIHANGLDDKMRRIAPSDLSMLKSVPLQRQAEVGDEGETTPASPSCPQCDGAGYYKEAVPFGHPNFGVLFPCACKLEQQATRLRLELLERSNLHHFQGKTFATFSRFVPKIEPAYSRAVAFSKRPLGWLVLFGTYGCGKTHLAAAMANALLARDIAIYFATVPDLLDHLRVAFKPDSTTDYDELFDSIKNVAVLFLDDLGTESATPWAKEKLYQLINHRYNTILPTVITSNRQPGDLDQRIYSRICDPVLGEPIEIQAGDYRRRKQTGGT
jgi:DNA replication protein DnaC